jgi:hypothetical protein
MESKIPDVAQIPGFCGDSAHKSYLSEFQDGEGFGKESRGLSPEVLIQFEIILKSMSENDKFNGICKILLLLWW